MDKKELDLEKLAKLRGISKNTLHSLDRNIRACYPKKSEKEIKQMVAKTLINNLASCRD